ncbi:SAM-dependent methyltransferase [Rhodohalobacter sp. 614A]|uniref:SAM-dependent methyltransferase n=1 Tax=Rhodohalobacter sp. 614A TaxID=2908649 RepID=UPI001F2E7BF8|nr:SAM-dependent methyltransferase [Rhodohalobacter sp. 614A]
MQTLRSTNTLYLIPTPIAKSKNNSVLPDYTVQLIKKLNCFIVEKVQTAQSFLQWIDHPTPLHEITFRVLNKKTPEHEVISFLKLLEDQSVGLMSEAGAPGVADPGAVFTKLVHEKDIEIVPLVGPSSILLALMASGLNGQQFSFHGYLPLDDSKRVQKIQELERDSFRSGFTHVFMETPHRNSSIYSLLLETLRPSTKLCIAANLTSDEEYIKTKVIRNWIEEKRPDLQKIPALFLINAK